MIQGLPLRPSAEQEKGRQISSVTGTAFGDFCGGLLQICNHLVLYLYAAGPAFHSLGIRANARVGFPESQDGPRRTNKTKWLHSVSCPGFMFGSEEMWCRCLGIQCVCRERPKSFIVRLMMYMFIVCQIVSVFALKEWFYFTESVLAKCCGTKASRAAPILHDYNGNNIWFAYVVSSSDSSYPLWKHLHSRVSS